MIAEFVLFPNNPKLDGSPILKHVNKEPEVVDRNEIPAHHRLGLQMHTKFFRVLQVRLLSSWVGFGLVVAAAEMATTPLRFSFLLLLLLLLLPYFVNSKTLTRDGKRFIRHHHNLRLFPLLFVRVLFFRPQECETKWGRENRQCNEVFRGRVQGLLESCRGMLEVGQEGDGIDILTKTVVQKSVPNTVAFWGLQ